MARKQKGRADSLVRRHERSVAGLGWSLELVLYREDGEEIEVGKIAQFENRKDLTPELRRAILAAAKRALTVKADTEGVAIIDRISRLLARKRSAALVSATKTHLAFWESRVAKPAKRSALPRKRGAK